ncbi:MAG: M20/M25/M40 family metallo-hydrolase [Bacteroidetes bacterium]|nr:M20/M25/M40 family metallo-hydrolase [Bacteroidota bacterium]
MKHIALLLFFLYYFSGFAQNSPPEILNLQAAFNYNFDRMTITFDLTDVENDSLEILFSLSDDNGATFQVDVSNATGDLGYPVMAGTNKKITWDAPMPINVTIHQVKIVALDGGAVDIQEMVDQVDSTHLKQDLSWIEGIRTRTIGLSHLEAVKDSIDNRFQGYNLAVTRQGQNASGYLMENIIGRQSGVKDPNNIYILDGHFDSVPNAPGADDNGSAVAGMLEAARILSKYKFAHTIHFIGFDQEETGGGGSNMYVNSGIDPNESVKGVVNLEMIGYFDNRPNTQNLPAGFNLLFPAAYNAVIADSSRGNFITNVGNESSAVLAAKFEQSANQYVPELKVITVLSPGNGALVPDLLRSDHAYFWLAGIHALMITDGADFRNPHYHTPGDTIGTLDFTFMAQVVKASLATIAELAQPVSADEEISGVGVDTSTTRVDPLLVNCEGYRIIDTEESLMLDFSQSTCADRQSLLKVFSMDGRLMNQISLSPGQKSLQLLKENYSQGIYLLSWMTEDGILSKKVLIR